MEKVKKLTLIIIILIIFIIIFFSLIFHYENKDCETFSKKYGLTITEGIILNSVILENNIELDCSRFNQQIRNQEKIIAKQQIEKMVK